MWGVPRSFGRLLPDFKIGRCPPRVLTYLSRSVRSVHQGRQGFVLTRVQSVQYSDLGLFRHRLAGRNGILNWQQIDGRFVRASIDWMDRADGDAPKTDILSVGLASYVTKPKAQLGTSSGSYLPKCR